MSVTKEDIQNFIVRVSSILPKGYSLDYAIGSKRIRVILQGPGESRSAWGFIDPLTGDIYKAETWLRPAKHVRGNILDPQILSRVNWTGPRYLR